LRKYSAWENWLIAMDALDCLALHIAWGADEALEDAPLDRTAAAPPPAPALVLPARPQPPEVPGGMEKAAPAAVLRARALAAAAQDIEGLRDALAGFRDCPLAATATNLVFADGGMAAGVMFIGEAPGEEEDRSSIPFSGPAGALLDRMLTSIGLNRTHVLLTTLVPWRPPGGRAPTESEIQMCLPFLHRHIALRAPRVLVTLGQLPTRALTGRDDAIRRARGRWREINIEGLETVVPVLPMFNPATLLHTPAAKKEAWADLLSLNNRIAQPSS
jgi:DNA polymerase